MQIHIRRLELGWQIADTLMKPVMCLAAGTFSERPQRTHRWNTQSISEEEIYSLDRKQMVEAEGIEDLVSQDGFRFHVPILGGWRDYIALSPATPEDGWHVGWISEDSQALSMVELRSAVRVLVARSRTSFFGLRPSGEQIGITQIGEGRIGERSRLSELPLL